MTSFEGEVFQTRKVRTELSGQEAKRKSSSSGSGKRVWNDKPTSHRKGEKSSRGWSEKGSFKKKESYGKKKW